MIRRRSPLVTRSATIVGVLLLLAQPTAAATMVNGDFETGTLAGWTKVGIPASGGSGGWFAYSGLNAPVSREWKSGEEVPRIIPPPPQGNFAAITGEVGFYGTRILYQDIPLEPGMTHSLSLITYYNSAAEITVPTPDTLSSEGGGNQQYRIDVMKPSAAIDSVNPADILATVFRTQNGAVNFTVPLIRTVDLTPFSGQVVRLRLAEVDSLGYLNAGVDEVTIQSIPRNEFSFGKLRLNPKKGTATLKVDVPWSGTLAAVDVEKKRRRIRKATVTATGPGTVSLKLKPTEAGKKRLKREHKLPFRLKVTFAPTGGTAARKIFSGKLKMTAK